MGEKVIRTCDVCGRDTEKPHSYTVTPAGRGRSVNLDLCDEHNEQFTDQWVSKGRRVNPPRNKALTAMEEARQREYP